MVGSLGWTMTKAELVKALNEWTLDNTKVVVQFPSNARHEVIAVKRNLSSTQLILILNAEEEK